MTDWKEDYRQAWRNLVLALWTNRSKQQRLEMVISVPLILATDLFFAFGLVIPLVHMIPPSGFAGMSVWVPAELGLAIVGSLWLMMKAGYIEIALVHWLSRRFRN